MLWLLLLPPYVAAFSWSSLFGGVATDQQQHVIQADPEKPAPYRVAVIGAGAAGSSAAFWISKGAERQGKEIQIDVFERSEYTGGRESRFQRRVFANPSPSTQAVL